MSGSIGILLSKSKNCFNRCTRRQFAGGTFLLGGMGLFTSSAGKFDVSHDPEAISRAYSNREELTWKDRLDLMWRKDEFGNVSPELQVQ